jgi:hypothetical protein
MLWGDVRQEVVEQCPNRRAAPEPADVNGAHTYDELRDMLFSVVDELDLSDVAIEKHGPLGTPPAELVRKVLDQKDRTIRMLKQGFVDAAQPAEPGGEDVRHGNATVRRNLMTVEGYSPYCGNGDCRAIPRTVFNGEQFECLVCGWVSGFPVYFVEAYQARWRAEAQRAEARQLVVDLDRELRMILVEIRAGAVDAQTEKRITTAITRVAQSEGSESELDAITEVLKCVDEEKPV